MATERYVLLGLARARTKWFSDVGQWATSAAIPAEFVKCVSGQELLARLDSGRVFSAALLDAGLPTVDRDLLAALRDAGVVPLIVSDGRTDRDWTSLGAATVLPPALTRETLLDALATHATMIDKGVASGVPADAPRAPIGEPGRVAAVCGTGGTGASTLSIALAQGLTSDGRWGRTVLLADFCRRAEQAMLHDARDVFPGVLELLEAHRHGLPSAEDIRGLAFHVQTRGYHLLLGLRQPRYWTMVRPRSLTTAFDSLRNVFRVGVYDIEGDFEGEEESGSVDVEERNLLSRHPAQQADVVFAVGRPGMKGLHSLVRLVTDLRGIGVEPDRIVPVVNEAPRKPRARAQIAQALGRLLEDPSVTSSPPPLFIPTRKVEEALQDGVRLPSPLPELLLGAFDATLKRAQSGQRLPQAPEPEPIAPGSLGVSSRQGGAA